MMNLPITIRIPIEPRPQRRDRIATIKGHARSYKAPEQAHYEAKVRAMLAGETPEYPFDGPLKVVIQAEIPIPASWSKKKKGQAIQGAIYPTGRPDVDNLAKQIFDIFNGIIWRDDKQIVGLAVYKAYGDTPQWIIKVMRPQTIYFEPQTAYSELAAKE